MATAAISPGGSGDQRQGRRQDRHRRRRRGLHRRDRRWRVGAAIGGTIGGAAGTGAVLATRGAEVELPLRHAAVDDADAAAHGPRATAVTYAGPRGEVPTSRRPRPLQYTFAHARASHLPGAASPCSSSCTRPGRWRRRRAAAAMPLTVDAIMRGPALVGYPPCDLRWSGDSRELYFEWRMPGEDEAATWVVGRDGGTPRRLRTTSAARRRWPMAGGTPTRRRILGVDRGDIVVIDTVARTRHRSDAHHRRPRRPRAGLAAARHVTFVRDNQVFVVPVDTVGGRRRWCSWSTRRRARRPPKLTDSQRTARKEEQKLIDWVEQEAARRERRRKRATARGRRCGSSSPSGRRSSMPRSAPTTPTLWLVGQRRRAGPHRAGAALRVTSRPTPRRSTPAHRRRRPGRPAARWCST